jgi:hypothetical protein
MDDDFIKALEHVGRTGGLPGDANAPATIAIRQRGFRENAFAWDEDMTRLLLTSTGRMKIASRRTAREGRTAEIRQFRKRS